MGSTLETAIAFPVILLVLTGFVIWPLGTARSAYGDFLDGAEEIDRREASGLSVCTEDLNKFLSGLSDNFRMIYGGILDVVSGEE